MLSSYGADTATAGITTAGAGPAGTVAVLPGAEGSVGAVRSGGEAGRLPAPIQEGLTADRVSDMADPDIIGEVLLRPPSAARGVLPATAARAGAVLRRRALALGPGQAGQGAARAADSARAEAQVPAAADPAVAAADPVAVADPVVAAAVPAGEADPEGVAPAALGAVAGPAVPGKKTY